jgi:hypothetical protein
MRTALCLLLTVGAAACSSPGNSDGPDDGSQAVEIGQPGGDDNLDFVRLEEGDTIQLQSFGQGGTHALLAVRCIGLGTGRYYVTVWMENLETGFQVSVPPPARPRPLACHSDGVCDLVPLLVMTGGLAEAGADLDGTEVEVTAECRNEDGEEAEGSQMGVLSTEEL